jgi:hypothetical protein
MSQFPGMGDATKQGVAMPLKVKIRYGIGEWYGRDFSALTVPEMKELVRAQFRELDCPFRPGKCNKKGGVCSLREFALTERGVVATGPIVTTCPQRFLQEGRIFEWIGQTLLGAKEPSVLKELPFLVSERKEPGADEEKVGRIDLVLASQEGALLKWCAVEMQAVYFSGPAMTAEFIAIGKLTEDQKGIPFPVQVRRPDFRSSGPKRLMPQLQIKVPTISRWGKKMAVVVDESFWNSLGKISEVPYISNSDIVWFIVKYDPIIERSAISAPCFQIKLESTHKCTLDRAVEGLTGGTPVSLEYFESELKNRLQAASASPDLFPSATLSSAYDEPTSSPLESTEGQDADPAA